MNECYRGQKLIDLCEGIIEVDHAPLRVEFWQKHYLREDYDFLIVCKSRRIGWSFITALKGLLKALDPNRFKYMKQFVSYSLEDAKEKIAFAREFYFSLPKKYRKELVSDTKTSLEFLDGGGKTRSRLLSLPCRQPRGKGGDISLDEFAFHPNDELIYTSALPVIVRGGYEIEIGSTPFGNKGKFYEIFSDETRYQNFKRINLYWWYSNALCVDVRKAVHEAPKMMSQERVERFGTEILKDIFDSMPLEDFQQEFECSYSDELTAFISLEMIKTCTPAGDQEIIPFKSIDEFILAYDPKIHGLLYGGYDVGRSQNSSVLTILGLNENMKTCWASIEYKNVKFDAQRDLLIRVLSELPIYRLCIDGTGLGANLGENLEDRFPRKAESVFFTNPVVEELANGLYLAMERLEVLLPPIRDLQLHIHSIRKKTTAAKHSRFDVDKNTKKHHGDRFFSLCLAHHAVGTIKGKRDFYDQWKEKKEQKKRDVPAQKKKRRRRPKSAEEVLASKSRYI
ncbi:MAG: hypothetical protein FVQ80_13935 [Planctomycetes bacterium]|nr:hypothetical protein [Planctomycetota bacterium]